MLLTYCTYLALGICLAGIIWRLNRWWILSIGPEAKQLTPGHRLAAAAHAIRHTLLSPKLFKLLGTLIADVGLQRKIAKQSPLRWLMHMGLFYAVLLLVLMHALDDLIMPYLVTDYAATRNPYMFLRNLLGFFLLMGVVIAWVRRNKIPLLKRFTNRTDRLTLILLTSILISGVGLEAVQIISPSLFDEMVVDYMGSNDPEETAPLKGYWAAYFDVAFKIQPAMDAATLEQGRELHFAFCAECHARPISAFVAYPVARMLKPIGSVLDRIQMEVWLWYFHSLASCLALAYLPFGKLFHLFSVPLSLVVSAVGDAHTNAPENLPARRVLGLDACTHCGVCSRHCSVAPIFTVIDNPAILPSEKTRTVHRMAEGRLAPQQHWALAQGSDICTRCGRCTDRCPSGIDLHDLWQAAHGDLLDLGFTPPHRWIRKQSMVAWAESVKAKNDNPAHPAGTGEGLGLSDNPDTFWACVQCTTCTNVCPVVAASDNPRRDLDLTPQQVMNLMRLELKHMAMGCRMVWDCVTCFKCQEHCPQGVPVADVLYELRNEACRRLSPDNYRETQRNKPRSGEA